MFQLSSSSSSSSDEENPQMCLRRTELYTNRKDRIESYGDADFFERFRLTKPTALFLFHLIENTIRSPTDRYICNICGKLTARSGDLNIHMRSHSGERPYACAICPKRYKMSSHLTDHVKTHTGDRRHGCDVCGKAFYSNRMLQAHKTIHTKERPLQCKFCGKTFSQRSSRYLHMKSHVNFKSSVDEKQLFIK